jgi:hypothetical protein
MSSVNPLTVIPPLVTGVTVFLGVFGASTIQTSWISSVDELYSYYPGIADLDVQAASLFFINGGQSLILLDLGSSNLETLLIRDPLSGTCTLSSPVLATLDALSSFEFMVLSPVLAWDDVTWFSLLQSYCAYRDAILLMNAPQMGVSDVESWFQVHSEFHEKHVAIYYPHVVFNAVEIGASYAVAGILNRLDRSFGVWVSPSGANAGFTPTEIVPVMRLGNPDTLRLNTMGMNCIRQFKSLGTVLWGSVTGVGLKHANPYWKYIQMRRTLFYIKKSILEGLRPLASLPYYVRVENDVLAIVEPFMLELFMRGAFAGKTVSEAYALRCSVRGDTLSVAVGTALLTPEEMLWTSVDVQMIS